MLNLGNNGSSNAGSEAAIVFENVRLAFDEKRVLNGVSFHLQKGESKVLFGAAGEGKSTILKLAMGLIKPDEGRIVVLGRDITRMPEEELFEPRRKLGIVFQEGALFDSLTVEENVAFRLMEEKLPHDQVRARVLEALRFVEMEHAIDKLPSQLSGGMRRRVAIARAIITQPEVLLYDSPTGGLDPITSTTIIELIVKQRDVYHTAALMVTHRIQDAFTMATHYFNPTTNRMERMAPRTSGDGSGDSLTTFLILRGGQVIFDGNAKELVSSQDEYIREYIS